MTVVATDTIRKVLNQARPDELASALQRILFGQMLERVEYDTGVITPTATLDLTALLGADGAPIAPNGAMILQAVRVVTVPYGGTAAAGLRTIGDSGATPSATVCAVSADGKVITFEGTVDQVVLVFTRNPNVSLDSVFTPFPSQ